MPKAKGISRKWKLQLSVARSKRRIAKRNFHVGGESNKEENTESCPAAITCGVPSVTTSLPLLSEPDDNESFTEHLLKSNIRKHKLRQRQRSSNVEDIDVSTDVSSVDTCLSDLELDNLPVSEPVPFISRLSRHDVLSVTFADTDGEKENEVPEATPASETPVVTPMNSATKRVSYPSPAVEVCHDEYVVIKKKSFEQVVIKNCPDCLSKKVKVEFTKRHLETFVTVECEECEVKCDEEPHTVHELNGFTCLSVYGEMLRGGGYSSFSRANALKTFPVLNSHLYQQYAENITKLAIEKCEKILEQSRNIVRDEYGKLGQMPNEVGILPVNVTYDGTCHTRGHDSNLGLGVAIDAETKLVLDYFVLSKYCSRCSVLKTLLDKKKITQIKYDTERVKHSPKCAKNYSGTSDNMEVEAAKILWPRSLDYNMRFDVMVSDGDTATFTNLKNMNNGDGPYPGVKVTKEECINHFSKRLKHRLGQLVKNAYSEKLLESGKKGKQFSLRGKDSLTDATIHKLASYFVNNIRKHMNADVKSMRNGVLASLYHCISTDEKPQHHLCPVGADSWCFHQRATSNNETPPSHNTMEVRLRLEPEDEAAVKKIYEELTSEEMMLCLKGCTQITNKSLHQLVGTYCPKTIYKVKRDLDFASAVAVSEYNAGYEKSCLDTSFGLKRSSVTQQKLRQLDARMQLPQGHQRKRIVKDTSYVPGGY
ncbi:hypothetical protein OTU49_003766 [Cherax quadricarinatus]|uniref:Mutator-like transposase domain-containing protein n=1 Tax=Cherax quadricarinatus TaxID=27406 RepID=A0AAW0XI25_CHEQU|nr:uncharacterized protein LOC128693037 isoform X1 [Cherax quadricarinatus]XP_053638499.1 uncharacterized protein LOC128693037 isoform X1 [Cherax quadricarinatus]XP_053638500.1 uncharacterized protein LOC128693037 isoform X1 [Cherax quadricarinatus]